VYSFHISRKSLTYRRKVMPAKEILRLVPELRSQPPYLSRCIGQNSTTLNLPKIIFDVSHAKCNAVRRLGIEEQEAPDLARGQACAVYASVILKGSS